MKDINTTLTTKERGALIEYLEMILEGDLKFLEAQFLREVFELLTGKTYEQYKEVRKYSKERRRLKLKLSANQKSVLNFFLKDLTKDQSPLLWGLYNDKLKVKESEER